MASTTRPSPAQCDEKAYADGYHATAAVSNGISHSRPHRSTVSQVRDPHFFKLANPGPLGLISFAMTSFVLGLYLCGAG